MTHTTFPTAVAVAVLTAIGVAACGGGGDSASSSPSPPKTDNGRPATVGVANDSDLGKILDNTHGDTLYLFAKDTGTTSTCTGPCAGQWPPLSATGKATVGAGARASHLGSTRRADGRLQVTYNGHPLYTYAGDRKPGDTNGQGLKVFGGGWYALSPSGNRVSGTGSNGGVVGY